MIDMPRKGFVPNITSRFNETTREKWKNKYKKVKTGSAVLIFGSLSLVDLKSFIIDAATSKVKLRGYKYLLTFLIGPWFQMVSIPFYLLTSAKKVRIFAIALCDIGAKISAGELTFYGWTWIISDLILFGEPVPIGDSDSIKIFSNETSVLEELLEVID